LLTLGSLFDGIGVFPLAASLHGIKPLWASEIEKAPISITKRRFPHMEHLGDITKMHGGEIAPVDIITFGSPCQNLSAIGRRDGLEGEQSSLFYHAIRIINEMRSVTNGAFPVFALWENVMGAFSSGNRMDFKRVLEAFSGSGIPMPDSGKWAKAGMVRGSLPDIAWRLMDARYWGEPSLAQRRRRIFLVADFAAKRASQILFNPQRMLQNTASGTNDRDNTANGDRISAYQARRELPIVRPFSERSMRSAAKSQNTKKFSGCFGKATDPFPTLLASGSGNIFAIWHGNAYQKGVIRNLTPTECERLFGLPDDWTAYGYDGERISDAMRYKALGNAIALPCAEFIIAGIKEVSLND